MSLAGLRFAAILLVAILVLGVVTITPGVFRTTGHELDLIHTLDISYRILEGDRPHLDFMTPLGVLSFLPISLLLDHGFGPGMAFLGSQFIVALLLLPGIWWVGMSRLAGWLRLAYGLAMLSLTTSLVFGAPVPALMASMHYNRWAWVVASFAILILMVPPRPGWNRPAVDGVLLGLSGAALALIKVTYVMALLPFVLLVVIRDRAFGRAGYGLLAMTAVVGAVTIWGGIEFWPAYVGDVLTVATADKRQFPGAGLMELTAAPKTLPATALLLLTVVFWRKVGMRDQGLKLFVLAPGFVYITYQNWGNDPKWLFLLGVLLLALPPAEPERRFLGIEARHLSPIFALLAFVMFAPTLMNIALSPVRHMVTESEKFSPMFGDPAKADIEILTEKNYSPTIEYPHPGIPFPEGHEPEEPREITFTLQDETFPDCGLRVSMIGWTMKAVEQLASVDEVVGRRILVADNYDHLWLYGPFERLRKMAPWYYNTDAGFDEADYVMVPLCAVDTPSRHKKLELIVEKGWELEEVIRTDLFILMRRAGRMP